MLEMLGRFSRAKSAPHEAPDISAVVPIRSPSQPIADDVRQHDEFLRIKVDLHRHLLDQINLSVIERISARDLAEEIRPLVKDYITARSYALNAREIDALVSDIADEMLGLGPIEAL